jgi:hypothetical protein
LIWLSPVSPLSFADWIPSLAASLSLNCNIV